MATQHPDNAMAPFWGSQAIITTNEEAEEIYQCFSGLGCDEYMWDWEGKFADEAMIERLVSNYFKYFQKNQLGRDNAILMRVPNIWEEKTFKLARAYMSILSSAEFTKSLKLHTPPVFELILPMTKNADQLIHLQKTFQKTAKLHKEIFGETEFGKGYIHVIPLFESVDDLANCAKVLEEFLKLHKTNFGSYPPYLRVFIARSDPALNAGFVSAVLATRLALREINRVSEKTGVPMYPIIGTGSLPFRGGINPENIEKSLPQYEGARTVTIQSAFRYDYPLKDVKKAVNFIKKTLKNSKSIKFNTNEFNQIKKITGLFKDIYSPTIETFAPLINEMAAFVPQRRERVQHIGLFGYSRGVGTTKLPRAISFTCACYSLGIPPEFIGTGRGLEKAKKQELLPLIDKHFPTLRHELQHAGKFLNRENLSILAVDNKWASEIQKDIELCEKILGIELGPQKENHFLHRNLTSNILLKKKIGKDFSKDLIEAAMFRKSLG
ncbi:MAG: phosphoenolpyruvate carboxylase [Candidatus Gracilibacteria bacterium]